MHERTQHLRALMASNHWDDAIVAEITDRTQKTVEIWRCANDDRVIPINALKLLQLTAKTKAIKTTKAKAGK